MQIRRFYCPDIPATGFTTLLPESEARHALKVLRLKRGEKMLLLDGKGIIAEAELLGSDRNGRSAECLVISQTYHQEEKRKLRLYVAPPHGKGFENVLKSAIEMGVDRISPILCRHAVAKPEAISDNWHKVMIAACKQAINPRIANLDQPEEFQQALRKAKENGFFGAVPDCQRQNATSGKNNKNDDVALWIGPEGGFDKNEENALLNAGYTPLTVGKCVLRVETAVPALIGMIYAIINPQKRQDE